MLPSIDKTNRNPAPPRSEHVRKLDPIDPLHPRDYAYELEHVFEREQRKRDHEHNFGEDTFEPSEDPEQEETLARNNSEKNDKTKSPDHDSNIDITV